MATKRRKVKRKNRSKKKWIQNVNKSIKRHGTKGKCTPNTKPGCTGRARSLALKKSKSKKRKSRRKYKMKQNKINDIKKMSPKQLSDMPDEMLLRIFENSSLYKLINLYKTNKHMKAIAKDIIRRKISNSEKGRALLDASKSGDTELVRILLDVGADVNIRDLRNSADDNTPLMWASYNRHTKIVRILLDAGADPNLLDKYDNTALMKASRHGEMGYTKIVRMLLDAGADVNIQDNDGDGHTALMWASDGDPEIVRMLLDAGADVNIQEQPNGETALIFASSTDDDDPEIVKMLLDAGAGSEPAQDIDGYTALQWARKKGNTEIEQLLIEYGATK